MDDIPFYDLGDAVRSRRRVLHEALDEVLDSGYFVGGEYVTRFENGFAGYLGAKHCIGVGNGLDGLRIALEVLGIGPGDEVLVPGFTFYATWLAVTQVGAIPVPVDVELSTAGIDSSAVGEAITSRTKAIIVVHLYGIPADLGALRKVADAAGIALVEDAAQSHGARAGAGMTGTVGDISSFSFYPTKNLGALGDAGAIVTNRSDLAESSRRRRSYGQGASKYDHIDTGWNSRLDSLQAAFLQDSLSALDAHNGRRREIAAEYLSALGTRSDRVIGHDRLTDSVWHHFVLNPHDRAGVRAYFADLRIGTDVHYPYFFNQVDPLRIYPSKALPNSAAMSAHVTSFPISPFLTVNQVQRVADAFAKMPSGLLR